MPAAADGTGHGHSSRLAPRKPSSPTHLGELASYEQLREAAGTMRTTAAVSFLLAGAPLACVVAQQQDCFSWLKAVLLRRSPEDVLAAAGRFIFQMSSVVAWSQASRASGT